jgi:pyruvate-formate lyase
LKLPRFGSGNEEIDKFGGIVAGKIGRAYEKIMSNPKKYVGPDFADLIDGLKKKYSLPGKPFSILTLPSYGTFEDYLGVGQGVGASADGRRKGASLSSNYSPMPSQSDMPPNTKPRDIFESLKGYNHPKESAFALKTVGPVDIDIREDFPKDELKKVLKRFANSELGSNIMSISCGNPEVLKDAVKFPERYDLLRLRMGGWNEFFITMFPAHQEQHKRRPIFTANKKK